MTPIEFGGLTQKLMEDSGYTYEQIKVLERVRIGEFPIKPSEPADDVYHGTAAYYSSNPDGSRNIQVRRVYVVEDLGGSLKFLDCYSPSEKLPVLEEFKVHVISDLIDTIDRKVASYCNDNDCALEGWVRL
jgi:hypothetical protein